MSVIFISSLLLYCDVHIADTHVPTMCLSISSPILVIATFERMIISYIEPFYRYQRDIDHTNKL